MKVLKNLQGKSKENLKTAATITISCPPNHIYYFGSFCLNQAEQQLLRNGQPVRLAPKAFRVLLVLIQNLGRLVTKERLLEESWPDAFFEEANLSVNIASLRKVLGQEGVERQYIETVPKCGYRFVALVSEFTSEDWFDGSQPIADRNDERRNEIINSVAVLPFENDGCGSVGEYLSDGLMESITNRLSLSRDLRVMARHTVCSCHRFNIDPRSVGHRLGVRSILAGRILRLDDGLIIRTELVDVMNGWQLWGEQYHTRISDILNVQQELAIEISERLKIRLSVDQERPVTTGGFCLEPVAFTVAELTRDHR
jgi:TolB-like protein